MCGELEKLNSHKRAVQGRGVCRARVRAEPECAEPECVQGVRLHAFHPRVLKVSVPRTAHEARAGTEGG